MDSRSEFQDLVHKHLNSLYSYALVLARQDAEDLLQESLVRAWEAFHAFDRSQSFKPWVFTIMRNAQIDRQRRRRAHPADAPLGDEKEAEPVVESPLCSIPLAPEDILLRRARSIRWQLSGTIGTGSRRLGARAASGMVVRHEAELIR